MCLSYFCTYFNCIYTHRAAYRRRQGHPATRPHHRCYPFKVKTRQDAPVCLSDGHTLTWKHCFILAGAHSRRSAALARWLAPGCQQPSANTKQNTHTHRSGPAEAGGQGGSIAGAQPPLTAATRRPPDTDRLLVKDTKTHIHTHLLDLHHTKNVKKRRRPPRGPPQRQLQPQAAGVGSRRDCPALSLRRRTHRRRRQ